MYLVPCGNHLTFLFIYLFFSLIIKFKLTDSPLQTVILILFHLSQLNSSFKFECWNVFSVEKLTFLIFVCYVSKYSLLFSQHMNLWYFFKCKLKVKKKKRNKKLILHTVAYIISKIQYNEFCPDGPLHKEKNISGDDDYYHFWL